MDPTISPPTDELRQRISSALESYRSKLYKINYEKLRSAVHDTNVRFDAYLSAPSEEEQADSIEERIASFEDQYLVGEYGGDPPELEDLVTNIDDLLDPDTARRILPNVINPPVTPEVCEQRMREIESEVQAQAAAASYDRDGGSDSNVALPNEYRVLMSLCDGILPSGLHSEVDSRSVVAIRGLAATQVPLSTN
ncbi:hypothetical protein H2203_006244 [Taxawa tesnikishii (nom. ined.)]|nr:hypothetical protein H2203_006244 [Dothideales sp. JES 119]